METKLIDILIDGSQFVIGILPWRKDFDVRYFIGIEINHDEAPNCFHLFWLKIG